MIAWPSHPLFSLGVALCWLIAAWQDLRRREIALLPLICLSLLGVGGHALGWWLLVGLAFAWPWSRTRAPVLIAPALLVGGVTGAYAPALALSGGTLAWGRGWWGGADGVMLTVLALRYGVAGLVSGCLMLVLFGLAFLLARRKLSTLIPLLADVLAVRMPDLPGPGDPETEMPAATALAAAGLALELAHYLL